MKQIIIKHRLLWTIVILFLSIPIHSRTYEYEGGDYTVEVGQTIFLNISEEYGYVLDTPIHNFIWIIDGYDNEYVEMVSDNQSVGKCEFKGKKVTSTPIKVTMKAIYKVTDDTWTGYDAEVIGTYYISVVPPSNTFTLETIEGIPMKFQVIDPKTCQVGVDYTYPAIDSNTSGRITIPETANGYKVVKIGEKAFQSCAKIFDIEIPNSVHTIGIGAFSGCRGLEDVVIPNSVKDIGKNAFRWCESLKNIRIPNSVLSIGAWAFSGCSNLKTIELANGVVSIEAWAFSGCKNLTEITIPESAININGSVFDSSLNLSVIKVDKNNKRYDSRDNCNAIIETSTNTLVAGCKGSLIPYGIEIIGNNAFLGHDGLTNIIIPNTVTTIQSRSFEGCDGLKELYIPNSVTTIEKDAFQDCSQLENVRMSESIINLDGFRNCTSLSSITIPNSANTIGRDAFQNCTALKTIYSKIEKPFRIDAFNYVIDGWHYTLPAALYVPVGTKNKYESIDGWKEFAGRIVEIDYPKDTKVSSISLTTTSLSLSIGDTQQLEATILPEDATDKSVTWISSNVSVATVNTIGEVKAIAEGSAIITCMANDGSGLKATCDVTIKPNPQSIQGDVNMDNAVNGTDLVALSNIVLGRKEKTESADVNGDGSVNGTDIVALSNIILGRSNKAPRRAGATDATLSIEPFDIKVGEEKEMLIDLTNPQDEVTLVQFDLHLPEGLSIKKNGADLDFDMAERTTWRKHTLDGNEVDGGYRFLLYSSSNSLIEGTEGAIIKMAVVADATFKGGKIVIDNALLVSPDEQETKPEAYEYVFPTVDDGSARLSIEDFKIKAGEEKEMLIDLTNPNDEITLVQFDLHLPEGLTIKKNGTDLDFDIAGRTTWRKHTLDANETEDGYRFLLYSSSNSLIEGTEGAIIKVMVVADESFKDGTIVIDNALLVSPDEKETKPERYEYGTGIRVVTIDLNDGAPVYNLRGQRLTGPQKGVNIIGGKKVVVK